MCLRSVLARLREIRRYPLFVRMVWWRYWIPPRVRAIGVKIGQRVSFSGRPIVTMALNSSIEIGDGCSLCSVSDQTALGVNHPIVLRTLRSGARIAIGPESGLSGTTLCAASSVLIGAQCLFGANVTVTDTDFHALSPDGRRFNNKSSDIGTRPVVIGSNVFIGANCIVLKGVTIGDNTVVGAGSIVSCSLPANVVAAGNPARVIRAL